MVLELIVVAMAGIADYDEMEEGTHCADLTLILKLFPCHGTLLRSE